MLKNDNIRNAGNESYVYNRTFINPSGFTSKPSRNTRPPGPRQILCFSFGRRDSLSMGSWSGSYNVKTPNQHQDRTEQQLQEKENLKYKGMTCSEAATLLAAFREWTDAIASHWRFICQWMWSKFWLIIWAKLVIWVEGSESSSCLMSTASVSRNLLTTMNKTKQQTNVACHASSSKSVRTGKHSK